jgi:hypothetical protein
MLHSRLKRTASVLPPWRGVLASGVAIWAALASCGAVAQGAMPAVAGGPGSALVAMATPAPQSPRGGDADSRRMLDEPELRQAAQSALWPADIVRLVADYLARFPDRPWAAEAAEIQPRALRTAALLRRNDVQLFRSAFDVPAADSGIDVDLLRKAALGDPAAALALAHQVGRLDGGARREIGWLQYASQLGSQQAAYALALYYRRESQPLLAGLHEARAIELGYVPPPSLEHERK